MRIFLDDERWPPNGCWHIARRMFDIEVLISTNQPISFISFDHDLGDNVPTGMDIAKYLVELDMDQGIFANDFDFYVHSQNPVGAENIRSYMNQYLKYKRG